ncbi:MAG TPA: serine hydrolase domain-containing protein, partial [Polyangia bacterium]|nr:serine hydrolase domain-containing protein [Polyangia bacterium]
MPWKPIVRLLNRHASLYVAAAILAVAAPPVAAGQSLDAAIKAERARLKSPAVSVAILEKGKIVYAKAFGEADRENSVAATTETRFRTASVAKTMTATAVLQLYERGAIDLDAPIQTYCGAFPRKPWPVTARQLLGHLAGVRHYVKPGESTGTEHFYTVTESLKIFANDPLLFEPGTKFSYTTYGFSVLGCAIEGASKTTYGEYMRAHVFEPAGMTHTSLDDVYLVIPQRARGYFLLNQASFDQLPPAGKAIAAPGGVYNAPLHDTSMKMPGGGLLSTPSDLMMFATALFDGKLLKPDTLKLMWTSQTTADGKPTEYGYGWGVGSSSGRLIVSHGGNQAGASSTFIVDVTNHLALAIMSNLEDADLSEVRKILTGPLSPTGKYTTSPPPAPALGKDEYRVLLAFGPNRYSGRMTLTIDGHKVGGSMLIEQPA